MMLERILELAKASDYDFRLTACPQDPLKDRFDEWVPYYRLKRAIAGALQLESILEVGVRYGYSALAFLDACPYARYLGIDSDSDTFGGTKGAIGYAKRATVSYRADYLIADSQSMSRLPGGIYDLIHLDGQQDETGWHHDLKLALCQARYVLVDGYFWTRESFLAVSEFLRQHRDVIEGYFVIPGYAGELLIRPRAQAKFPFRSGTSLQIRDAYTEEYFLNDCGGYNTFRKTRGAAVLDSRLLAMVDLASIVAPGRALDLGCGRGELTVALAELGHEVTAIDYSESAISLARSSIEAASLPRERVALHCANLNEAPLSGSYDAAVCADVIEHLSPAELEQLYARMADCLKPNGVLLLHTYPNVWFYRYEYAWRRRLAARVGAYLPIEPRSRYEQLMHINEQSPRQLRRQLFRHFPFVLVWFADHSCERPAENLERPFSLAEMRSAGDLFAVAAHIPIEKDRLVACLSMDPLREDDRRRIFLEVLAAPEVVGIGQEFNVTVRVLNMSAKALKPRLPYPIFLSYHWYDERGGCLVFDGVRSTPGTVAPGCARKIEMRILAPRVAGRSLLQLTIVQESVAWFSSPPVSLFQDVSIRVE